MFVVFFRFAFQLSQPTVLRNATRTLSPKKWQKKSNEKTDMKTTSKTCYSRKFNAFTVDSHLICPKCNVQVHIGTGGQNLDLHLTSKACNNRRKVLEEPTKKSKTLLSFFGPREASKENVPRVRSPTPIHADPVEPILMPGPSLLPPQTAQDEHATTPLADDDMLLSDEPRGCQHVIEILQKLPEKLELIPKDIALAGPEHPLALRLIFTCDTTWPLPTFLSGYNYPHPKLKD